MKRIRSVLFSCLCFYQYFTQTPVEKLGIACLKSTDGNLENVLLNLESDIDDFLIDSRKKERLDGKF